MFETNIWRNFLWFLSLQDRADEDEKKFNKKISDLKGMLRKLEERNKQLVEDKADLVGEENLVSFEPHAGEVQLFKHAYPHIASQFHLDCQIDFEHLNALLQTSSCTLYEVYSAQRKSTFGSFSRIIFFSDLHVL